MGVLNAIWCAIVKVLNALNEHVLENIIELLGFTIDLLPSIPLGAERLEWGAFGNSIGYFIPIQTMVTHFIAMCGIMGAWYSIEYIMRWIKMIK